MNIPRSFYNVLGSIVLLLGTGVFSFAQFSSAQSVDELKANVTDLNAKIEAIDKEIKEYALKISQTQGESNTLRTTLNALELSRKKLVKQIDSTNLKIKQASNSIEYTKTKITQTESTIDKNRAGLAQLINSQYTDEKSLPLLMQVITPNAKISDVIDEVKRSQDLSSRIQVHLADLKSAQNSLVETKTEFEIQRTVLQKLQNNLSDQRFLVEQNKEEKNKLLIETKNKETAYQKLLADRKKKKTELEKEVLDYESKIQTLVDVSKLPKYGKGVLKYPVNNVKITQHFGTTAFSTQNPQVYNGMGHNGIDFAVPTGTAVYSAAPGVVIGTGDTDAQCNGVSYGRFVLVRHANGLTTLYAHLSKIGVSAGQNLGARDQIGLSGNTGYSTGPHVHFTVYASDVVRMTQAGEYKSKVCGTYLIMPVAPRAGYLNPLSYL